MVAMSGLNCLSGLLLLKTTSFLQLEMRLMRVNQNSEVAGLKTKTSKSQKMLKRVSRVAGNCRVW